MVRDGALDAGRHPAEFHGAERNAAIRGRQAKRDFGASWKVDVVDSVPNVIVGDKLDARKGANSGKADCGAPLLI